MNKTETSAGADTKPMSEDIKVFTALEFSDVSQYVRIPGEIEIDAHGQLLRKFVDKEGLLGSQIETFNKWIISTIASQIAGLKFKIPRGEVTASNPMFYPPRISTSGNSYVPLTPKMCRDNGYTYASELYVDLILNANTAQEEKLPHTFLGKVPVMLGSVLCHLYGKTEAELIEMGECPKDPFGYFIIKGSEKVIMIQEKLRVNRIFIFNSSSKGDVVCKMTCNTIRGSSNVTLVKGKKTNALEVHLSFMGRSDAQAGKVGNTVTAFQIYRMLGVKDPNQILGMIAMFTKREYIKKIWVQLQPTFVELGQVTDDIEYIAKKKGLGDLPYSTKQADILRDLKNQLFPHIPPENITQKLQMLSIMIARFTEYLIGVRKLDDRDNWGNKRLESAGRSLEQLFGNIWREIVSRAQDSIDSKNLQGLQAVRREIDPSFITDNFVSSFNANNWGVQGSYMAKENITEQLKRDAVVAVYSHLTKINTPTSRKAKQLKVRLVQMSQLGYVCMVETPEGSQCGLVKNGALTLYISIERDENVILESIKDYISRGPTPQTKSPLILNGRFLGWCDGEGLRNYCVSERRRSAFYKDTVIVLDRDGFLYIYTDGARPTRPLLVVGSDGELVIKTKGLWNEDMQTLLDEGCVEYIDAFEQEYIQLAQTMEYVQTRQEIRKKAQCKLVKETEKLKSMEPTDSNYAAVKENLRQVRAELTENPVYTHCELDPIAIMGIAAALIPLANHNQAPRNTYQCGMGKQALGIYNSQHHERFDTTGKCLAYPSRPMFETEMNELVGLNELPAGATVVMAIMAHKGYNQEDAIIINQAAVDRGLFRQVIYKSFKNIQKRTRFTVEEFARPEIRTEESDRYAAIGEDGLPRVGAFVREGDCIIGKIRRNIVTKKVDNASTFVGVGLEGIIDKVLASPNPEGMISVKVKLRQIRKPIMGDKFASRHAQKSTVGLVLPPEAMPFTADGVTPDIIINPHCIPSRMTMAKMIETIVSKVAAHTGQRVNATAYRSFDVTEFQKQLESLGFSGSGKETMYSGFTGKQFEAKIFIGPCYYQALRHHVLDKVQMRAQGAIKQLSHQPVGGRARKGGQRFGEMERDAIISHGASAFLKERLCGVSDAYKTTYCTTCGKIAISNAINDKFICRTCNDDAKFGKNTIPYAYKLLTHMLAGAGFNLKFGMSEKVEKAKTDEADTLENEEPIALKPFLQQPVLDTPGVDPVAPITITPTSNRVTPTQINPTTLLNEKSIGTTLITGQ